MASNVQLQGGTAKRLRDRPLAVWGSRVGTKAGAVGRHDRGV